MNIKLFDYQADFIRESGMCPRKVDDSQPLCAPEKCPECKERAKKASLEAARAAWIGESVIPKGETFEKESQNELPDPNEGVPLVLKKYEPLFHFDPSDLILDSPDDLDIDKMIRAHNREIYKKYYGFGQ